MTPADCRAILDAWFLSPQCPHKLAAAHAAMTLVMLDAREQTTVRGEMWFGFGRAGGYPGDWRTMSDDRAIEHDRTAG